MQPSIKVAYVNLMLRYHGGIFAKLAMQANSARAQNLALEYYWLPAAREVDKFPAGHGINFLPIEARGAINARFRQATLVNELCERFDAVVLRYPLFDPVLFAFLKRKSRMVTEHHTKEIAELKLAGDPRWLTERIFGGIYLSLFGGSVGVTNEIVDYENDRRLRRRPAMFIPNTVDPEEFLEALDADRCIDNRVKFIFVANEFVRWHGLEEVLKAWKNYARNTSDELHVVGKCPESPQAATSGGPIFHGRLGRMELMRLYRECDYALGSFRLDLLGMREGSTLKLREYLASGLPVACGQADGAFPDKFPYILYQPAGPDFAAMRSHCERTSNAARRSIADKAREFIAVDGAVRKLHGFAGAISVAERTASA